MTAQDETGEATGSLPDWLRCEDPLRVKADPDSVRALIDTAADALRRDNPDAPG